MMAALAFADGSQWVKDPSTAGFYLGWGLVGVNGWCWTLVALWLGMRLLDYRNHRLDQAQELMVPFYVFHQPPIVLIAFFVVGWAAGIPIKLGVILGGSLLITLGLCLVLAKYVKPARVLFGMKPSLKTEVAME